jgi:phosphoribosylformylglycinamidine synthase
MNKAKAIILSGYGLNCEQETAEAFVLAGGEASIVHINDLIAKPAILKRFQILAIPGGFSYGDDLGSGKAYANKLNNHLKKYLAEFAAKDKLIIGICNGFQILTNLGLLPGVLTFNDNNRYTDRWVDIKITSSSAVIARSASAVSIDSRRPERSRMGDAAILSKKKIASDALAMTGNASPWLKGIKSLSLPIAHGEGKFMASADVLKTLKKQNQIAGVYYKGNICKYQSLPANPNGSMLDIAAITSENGRILGIMPHPERGMFFTQTPDWTLQKEKLSRKNKPLPKFTNNLQIFKNAISYFQ